MVNGRWFLMVFLLCRNYILHSCPRKGVALILLVHFPGLWTKSVRHIVHITGLWHHRLKTVKLFLEPICVRFRVAKSPFLGAQFNHSAVNSELPGCCQYCWHQNQALPAGWQQSGNRRMDTSPYKRKKSVQLPLFSSFYKDDDWKIKGIRKSCSAIRAIRVRGKHIASKRG